MADKKKRTIHIARDAALERAAKTRALVVSHLNEIATHVDYAQLEAGVHEKLIEIGGDTKSLRNVVQRLADNKQITAIKQGRRLMFSSPSLKAKRSAAETDPLGTVVRVPKRDEPDVRIQIVKSTGAVRLQHGKMLIELSFVDK